MTPRCVVTLLVVVAVAGLTGGEAAGIDGGKPALIQEAPWAVAVLAWGNLTCTGVIADPIHVLTAGHCLYEGPHGSRIPTSAFTIDTGVSNIKHPLASDAPQTGTVSAVRLIPGYMQASRENLFIGAEHDLAVLTLSHPLDLTGRTVRAARLLRLGPPDLSASTRFVIAGFGRENPSQEPTGGLNELVQAKTSNLCPNTVRAVCIWSATNGVCAGDSGLGLVKPGSRPTVIGILTRSGYCTGGLSMYIDLGSAPVLRFVNG